MAGVEPIKCVVVGPPRSGKSSMLLNLTTGETSDETKEHIPTVFENYKTKIEHAGQKYELRYGSYIKFFHKTPSQIF